MFFGKEDKKKTDKEKGKESSDKNEKKQKRPWYDISTDDLIEFDMFDDD